MLEVIAFDADDTLWHNEDLFTTAQQTYWRLLAPYRRADWTENELYDTEMENLHIFGYGAKAFTLSMVETALNLTNGQIKGTDLQKIFQLGKSMLEAPVRLLDHAAEEVAALSKAHKLMVITKGDLLEQERKFARSGLAQYFTNVEIVRDKTLETYQSIFARYCISPQHFLMVGNSLRSDIVPIVTLGGHAVHIPYHTTWKHEEVDVPPMDSRGYAELEHLGLLLAHVEELCQQTN